MTNRKKRKRKQKPPAPYRSWFEHDFHQQYNQLEYEPITIDYVSKHKYTPDFLSPCGNYMFEAKGRFRNSSESRKYIDIRDCLFDDEPELIFILMDPKTPMPNAKKRKDGTKATISEWCDRHGFQWCTQATFKKKEWIR